MRLNIETSNKSDYKKIQLENARDGNKETFYIQKAHLFSLAQATREKQLQWQRAHKDSTNKPAQRENELLLEIVNNLDSLLKVMTARFQEIDSIKKQLECIAILTLVSKLLQNAGDLGNMANLLDKADGMNEKPIQTEQLLGGVIYLTLALGLPLAPILPMALLTLGGGALMGSIFGLVFAAPLAFAALCGAVIIFERAYEAYNKMDVCSEKVHDLAKSLDHDNYMTATNFSFTFYKDKKPVTEEFDASITELPLGFHQS